MTERRLAEVDLTDRSDGRALIWRDASSTHEYEDLASGLASGTSFPGSPSAGDRYFRTDLGMEFYYDGTRWLSMQIFRIELKQEDTVTWPLTATTSVVHRAVAPFGADFDLWLMDWHWMSVVLTTNTGSAYWTVTLRKFPVPTGASSVLVTAATSADAADNAYQKKSAINALLGSYGGFFTDSTKTSTPGNHRFVGGHITCRVVGT